MKRVVFMKFVRVIGGYDHLWAVKEPDKEFDELTSLFEKWNNADYLLDFFKDNIEDLRKYFQDRRSTRLNSSHPLSSRMPSTS